MLPNMLSLMKKHVKIIRTCNLYLSILSLAIGVSLTGPCLLDLQKTVGTDTQHIALIYTSRSVGYVLGAILGGIVLDIVRSKQAVLTVCNFFVSITMLGIPWSRSVGTLLGFVIFNGIALGAINTGANVVCIELWGSGPFLQALHFAYGVGGLIAPLIAAPFLASRNFEHFSNVTTNFSETDTFLNTTSNFSREAVYEGAAHITYPFSIAGLFSLLVATSLLVSTIVSPLDEAKSKSDTKDNANRSCIFMFGTVIFTFFVFFVVTGTEIGFGQTLTTYAVKGELKLTTRVGSYMTSVYWASYTVARLICTFLSIKINSMTLIIGDIVIILIAGMLLVCFMPNEWTLWVASVTFGVGIASGFPSLVGWLDTHITITNKISAIFTVGCAAGELLVPFLIAYFIEILPEMFAYVIIACGILTSVLLSILYLIIRNGEKICTKTPSEYYDTNNKEMFR